MLAVVFEPEGTECAQNLGWQPVGQTSQKLKYGFMSTF